MPDLIGQDIYKDRIRELEITDPAHPSTWNPNYQDLINNDVHLKGQITGIQNEIETARGGFGSLDARLDAMETQTMQGERSFASTSGVTVTHNLGHTNYIVNIAALADTGGDLGDVYVVKAANVFTVYNTGGFAGPFRYQIMT